MSWLLHLPYFMARRWETPHWVTQGRVGADGSRQRQQKRNGTEVKGGWNRG